MTTDYRALLLELVETWDSFSYADAGDATDRMNEAVEEARTALAEPEPVGPRDEEIMELMPQRMRDDLAAAARAMAGFNSPTASMGVLRIILNRHAVDHARAVLTRWGRQPAPDA